MSQPSQLDRQPLLAADVPAVAELYTDYAAFVWRNLRRLGVRAENIEDAVQDVFLAVHRKLPEFESRSSLRTWIFGIALRVAARHREQFRKSESRHMPMTEGLMEVLSPVTNSDPFDHLAQQQAADLIDWALEQLDEEKRAILIMVELEELPVVEVAKLLDIKLNTAYSRLRLARHLFEAKLKCGSETGETS